MPIGGALYMCDDQVPISDTVVCRDRVCCTLYQWYYLLQWHNANESVFFHFIAFARFDRELAATSSWSIAIETSVNRKCECSDERRLYQYKMRWCKVRTMGAKYTKQMWDCFGIDLRSSAMIFFLLFSCCCVFWCMFLLCLFEGYDAFSLMCCSAAVVVVCESDFDAVIIERDGRGNECAMSWGQLHEGVRLKHSV